jgi:hypothetical protein
VTPSQSFVDLDRLMERYQQADRDAPATLVEALSPALLRFFSSQLHAVKISSGGPPVIMIAEEEETFTF